MLLDSFISSYKNIKVYLYNTFWILGERVLSIILSFVVTVIVARYLGPEKFGLLSYAVSLVAIFTTVGHMGLAGLVVREIVKRPELYAETLGTTLVLKFVGAFLGYVALLVYAAMYEGVKSIEFSLIATAGLVLLVQPFGVVDYWFQAFLKAKYSTVANVGGLLVASILKVSFVLGGFTLIYLVVANVVQAILVSSILLIIFIIKTDIRVSSWRFRVCRAKELLGQGWLIYLGSLFAIMYLKVDQVMLRWFIGVEEVGSYAIATQLSEVWYFLPAAIVASFFPKLIGLRETDQKAFHFRLQQLLDILFIIAFIVAIIVSLSADYVISMLFGDSYRESASILVIHIWAAVFIFMRAVLSKWIIIEGVLVFSLITQGAGAFVNVALNYIFIPEYGGRGAAFATLISYAVASYFSLFLYKRTRPIFWSMSRSIVSPFRYAYIMILKIT